MHTAGRVRGLVIAALVLVSGCTTSAQLADEAGGSCDGEETVLASLSSALSTHSCEERSDTGYKDGQSFSIKVVTVDGKPVEVETANAYLVMAEAASRAGVEIRIVSGFRTMAEQQHLYSCYQNCNCNSCNLAARPGYSNHQSGHALDLNTSAGGVLNWLNNNGSRFGFRRTVPSEAWHWEWWGGGPGGGPCGRAEPPTADACAKVPAEGKTIEETSGCFYAKGPSQYWRKVDSAGHGGKLMWTNAFKSSTPSNWARWYTPMQTAGRYKVQVWAEQGFAVYNAARYVVKHAGEESTVRVNLSGASGWRDLGTFQFAAGASQHVSVYDNVNTDVPENQKIPADALRIVPAPAEPPPATDPPATDPPATDPPATDPPATDPPATDPPATDPPATDPPATDPPATDPTAVDPPVNGPPVTGLPTGTPDPGTVPTGKDPKGGTFDPEVETPPGAEAPRPGQDISGGCSAAGPLGSGGLPQAGALLLLAASLIARRRRA